MKLYTVVRLENGEKVPEIITDLGCTLNYTMSKSYNEAMVNVEDLYKDHDSEEISEIISGDIYVLELELTEEFVISCISASYGGWKVDFQGKVISSHKIDTEKFAAKIIEAVNAKEKRNLEKQIAKAEAKLKELKSKMVTQ